MGTGSMPFSLSPELLKVRKHSSSPRRVILWYSILFIPLFVVAFAVMWKHNRAFLWETDGISQHVATLLSTNALTKSFVDWVISGAATISTWDQSVGLGFGVINNVVFFRPINFLFALFGIQHIELFLLFRCALYMYCSGITFLIFARSKINDDFACLIGAISYSFSAYSLYFGPKHTFFLEMTIYLPLLMYGADQIIDRGFSIIYTFAVFLLATSYFYFLFIDSIAMLVYVIVRLIYSVKDGSIRSTSIPRIIATGVLYYVLGCAAASFSLIPALISAFGSARSIGSASAGLLWPLSYYVEMLQGIVGANQVGQYGFIAIPPSALFAITYLVLRRDDTGFQYLLQLLIFIIVLCVPALSMVFSGFAGKTLRWCFVLSFWISFYETLAFSKFRVALQSSLLNLSISFFVISILDLCSFLYMNKQPSPSWLLLAIVSASVMAMSRHAKSTITIRRSIILILCFVEVFLHGYETFADRFGSYAREFVEAGRVIETYTDCLPSAVRAAINDSYCRIDSVESTATRKNAQLNYGVRTGTNGLSSYYSFMNREVSEFSALLGNTQQNTAFLINSYDQRTIINELLSVRYLIAMEEESLRLPFGYELNPELTIEAANNGSNTQVYENQYYLPLLYAYNTYVPSTNIAQLNSYEIEEVMMQSAVLEEDVPLDLGSPNFSSKTLLSSDEVLEQLFSQKSQEISVFDNSIVIDVDGATISLEVPEVATGEIYLVVNGLSFIPAADSDIFRSRTSSSLTVSMDNRQDECIILAESNQYYMGARDYQFCLGYGPNETTLSLSFLSKGCYTFDSIEVVYNDFNQYSNYVEGLKPEALESFEILGNTVSISITCENDELCCLSVPYSTGWKALVNGGVAKVYRVNGMFVGVLLPKGESMVTLRYETPGLKTGAYISLVAIFVTIILMLIHRRRDGLSSKFAFAPSGEHYDRNSLGLHTL